MMRALAAVLLLACSAVTVRADGWPVDTWMPPFDYTGAPGQRDYIPLATAAKPWRICASYPHLKDSYWLSVNYGMVEHARRLGIRLQVVEAGGYPNLERQIAQVKDCAATGSGFVIASTLTA